MKTLTKADFRQIDSQWIFAIGKFHLAIVPDKNGHFVLQIFGSVEPIPPATQYPSEPEWERTLDLANKFLRAYVAALEKE